MGKWIVAYLTTGAVFVAGDFVWLGFIARTFYRDQLGALMLPQPYWPPAIAFYLLYAFGIVFFAVAPAASWTGALVSGGLLGLIAYATYDLSNFATLKGWPAAMTAIDILWGASLTALAATIGYLAARALVGGD